MTPSLSYNRARSILADPAHQATPVIPGAHMHTTPQAARDSLEATQADLTARLTAAATLLAKVRSHDLNDGTNSINDTDRYAATLIDKAVTAGAERAAATAITRRLIRTYNIAAHSLAEAASQLAAANNAMRALTDLAAEKS